MGKNKSRKKSELVEKGYTDNDIVDMLRREVLEEDTVIPDLKSEQRVGVIRDDCVVWKNKNL